MIVVTGGAGFIGSVMIWQLNQSGRDDLLVVDGKANGNACANLSGLMFQDYLSPNEFLSRLDSLHRQHSIEAIIHLGACSATTETDASFLYRNNYRYTKTLAEWSIKHNARFIYASSGFDLWRRHIRLLR